jgi:hypothetical protein
MGIGFHLLREGFTTSKGTLLLRSKVAVQKSCPVSEAQLEPPDQAMKLKSSDRNPNKNVQK